METILHILSKYRGENPRWTRHDDDQLRWRDVDTQPSETENADDNIILYVKGKTGLRDVVARTSARCIESLEASANAHRGC
jgi:hypothetical protein